jgi:hypothetical protein
MMMMKKKECLRSKRVPETEGGECGNAEWNLLAVLMAMAASEGTKHKRCEGKETNPVSDTVIPSNNPLIPAVAGPIHWVY